MDGMTEINKKLDTLLERTARTETNLENLKESVNEKITGLTNKIGQYNNVTSRLTKAEGEIERITSNCSRIQDEKAEESKRRRIPWNTIFASIMSGSIVGLIMYFINK